MPGLEFVSLYESATMHFYGAKFLWAGVPLCPSGCATAKRYKGCRRGYAKTLDRLCTRQRRDDEFESHVYNSLPKGNCLGENAGQSASKSSGESYA